ncbi:MAG: nucleotidyltransferase domain-containing protein [Nanoarchaeota archaeon]
MRQDNYQKMLEVFYEYPTRRFTIREIEKLTKIPRATVHKQLINLKKEKMITVENQAETTLIFKIKKINYYLEKIVASGLLEELIEKLNPSCIILFGSVRKGESVKESDIDLFVESFVKKEFSLKKFEGILKHPIQLLVNSDMHDLDKELLNNVVNGIKLFGSFKIK